MKLGLLIFGCLVLGILPLNGQEPPKVLRVGIIGCDTSHVPAFTAVLNNSKSEGDLAGFKVVAAYPGGSPDLPISRDRVDKFATQLKDKFGVEIVSSIDDLISKVDVVLLESVDGRVHLAQATPVLKARKPLFIDKPMAASLADGLRIVELAKEHKTPLMSCSSLRFGKKISEIKADPKVGPVLGCLTFGPCSIAEFHPDLSFYGIHGLEMLYAFMGPGCKTVTRSHSKDCDVVTGVWNDGRVATYRGLRSGKSDFGAMIFGKTANVSVQPYEGYTPMLQEVCKFFRTGVSPVSHEEMLEVLAVIDAADVSKKLDGGPVSLASVFAKARGESTK